MRPEKARKLGYKRAQGYVVYRIRIRRGGRKRLVRKGIVHGKPVHQGIRKLKKERTHKSTAEERVGRKCSNLRVLNSYWVGQDAAFKFYEVVMVDPNHKNIRRNPQINWICSAKHNHRELRGVTATGRKAEVCSRRVSPLPSLDLQDAPHGERETPKNSGDSESTERFLFTKCSA